MIFSGNNTISGNEMKMSEILEKISNNEYVKKENPFNNPNFVRNEFKDTQGNKRSNFDKEMEIRIKSDMDNFHKSIKESVNESENRLIDLSNRLISAVLREDMVSIYELTSLSNFKDFADIKDTAGFNAIEYAITYGKNHIIEILLKYGASEDNLNLDSFFNINVLDNDDTYNNQDNNQIVNVPIYDSEEPEDWKDLPTDDGEKIRSLSDETESFKFREKAFSFRTQCDNDSSYYKNEDNNLTSPIILKQQVEKNNSPCSPINRVQKIKEEALKFTKSTESKKNVKPTSFVNAFKKNFSKNGFSDEREFNRIKVPKGKETTVDEMEEILKKSGISLNNTGTYSAINNIFLEKYSKRDVSRLLVPQDRVDSVLFENRIKMLPVEPNKDNLKQMVTGLLQQQLTTITNEEISNATEIIYEYILFYRDFFLRIIEINNITVKESSIHGKGVFATKDIKEGSLITFYFPYFLEYVYTSVVNDKEEGIVILPILSRRRFSRNNNDEIDYLRKGTIRISDHFMLVGDDQYFTDHRICGHMINDPCDFSKGKVTSEEYERQIIIKANASVVSYEKDRRFIYVAATRDIKQGEEILIPYGSRYWEL